MKKALLVIAHPDDEVIFFWWALQNPDWKCEILCCSSDLSNPRRPQWHKRLKGLDDVCSYLGVHYSCLAEFNSGFSAVGDDLSTIGHFRSCLIRAIRSHDHDLIVTHNRFGEYGKFDHQLINHIIVTSFPTTPIYWSNIFIPLTWTDQSIFNHVDSVPAGSTLFVNDVKQYDILKAMYEKIECWTWKGELVQSCIAKRIDLSKQP